MRKFKIVLLILLGIIDLIFFAVSIAYLVMGIQVPNSLGDKELFFTGSYLLFIAYFAIFILTTFIFILCLKRLKKSK